MQPGEQIGDYIIVEKIGEGGMSVVYLAEHKGHQTQAVVKQLHKHLTSDERLVKRFVQSWEIMQRLQHPHLARVFEFIKRDGDYFMVEEYLSGGSLADLVKDLGAKGESVSEKEALCWCRDALYAVDYAHQNRIVHRDLKPGNLMLNGELQVKVTDFGIARVFGDPRLTQTGTEMGTAVYMSPEQIRTPDKAYHLTDVYSMGVVLYELLTHSVPFEDESEFEIKRKVVQEPPAPPRQLNPRVSREAERIVLKALQKRPGDRFGGCGEFALEIDRLIKTMYPQGGLSGSSGERKAVKPIKNRWRIAAGFLLLFVLAMVLVRVIDYMVHRAKAPTIELVAKDATISSGQSTSLEWSAENADKVRIEPEIGEVQATGSRAVTPTKSVTYVATVTGPGGTASRTVAITVGPPTVILPPKIAFAARPAKITQGQAIQLEWSAENADKIRIEPEIGEVARTGSRTVAPTQSVTYSATATGPGGTVSRTFAITVEPLPKAALPKAQLAKAPLPTIVLAARPASVKLGEAIQLEWNAQNASTVRIDPDLGEVPATGSRTVTPTGSVIYSATVTGPGGTIERKVDVVVKPAPAALLPTIELSAVPTAVKPGQAAELAWRAENADRVSIAPDIGDVPVTGSRRIVPTKSATYVVTATGRGGIKSATVAIVVEPLPPPPTVFLDATPTVVRSGQMIQLEWRVKNADQVRIEPDVGDVAASGRREVTPRLDRNPPGTTRRSVTYTVTATGPGGTKSAKVDVTVQPTLVPAGTLLWSPDRKLSNDEIITIAYIDDRNITVADIGSVRGSLPGVAIKITLSDREHVSVVEDPNRQNRYKKIRLRLDRGAKFPVAINWTVVPN